MRRGLICLVALTAMLSLAGNAGADLVAHWSLDDGSGTVAHDFSGNGYDGTLMGGPQWVAGQRGGALEFDGSDDWIDFGNPPGLPSGLSPRSVAAWVRTDSVAAGYRVPVGYGSPAGSQAMGFAMNGDTLYGFGYGNDVVASGFWEIGVWYHLCLTYDGTTAVLYANGVEIGSEPKTWNLILSTARIGRQVNNAAEFWDGTVDDVRIYDHVLAEAEVLAAMEGGLGYPYALGPDPQDGVLLEATWVNLGWRAGDSAVSHDVYLGDNFDDVNDGAGDTFRSNLDLTTTSLIAGFTGYAFPDGLVPGTTYYWRIDEVNDADPNSPWKGDVWSFSIPPKTAYNPSVSDGAKFVATDMELSWTAGFGAQLHTVYFGDDVDTVSNATDGAAQSNTTYTPGPLETDKTYYWRVDEFAAPLTHTGDVWSFTTVPNVPVGDPDLVGWWTLDEGIGTTAVDWSGHGNHGTLEGDPEWTDGYDAGALDLDGTGDYVNFGDTSTWPAGVSARSMCGWSKSNTVVGGWRWIAAYGSGATSQAMFLGMNGDDLFGGGYGDDVRYDDFWQVGIWHHICLTYDGSTARLYADGVEVASEAKDWNLNLSLGHLGRQVNSAAEFWDGAIDDVRVYSKVLTPEQIAEVMRGNTKLASNPVPDLSATVDIRDISSLSWSAGDTAVSHDVYFGLNRNAVADADNSSPEFQGNQAATSLSLASLVEFGGGDYYWRIDEVAADGTIIAGTIWMFTVPDYLIVDNFESYDNIDPLPGEPGLNRIFDKWIDGFGTATNGALVGNDLPPYAETTIVQGGAQSMIFRYDNTNKTSEATLTLAKNDWTVEGVMKLSLWIRGDATNAADRVFVALNGAAVIYHEDPAATQLTGWKKWIIDLATFGIDLTNVNSITLGVGTKNAPNPAGGMGTIHFDEILLIR